MKKTKHNTFNKIKDKQNYKLNKHEKLKFKEIKYKFLSKNSRKKRVIWSINKNILKEDKDKTLKKNKVKKKAK